MEKENCEGCKKLRNQYAAVGVVAGVAVGFGLAFAFFQYVRKLCCPGCLVGRRFVRVCNSEEEGLNNGIRRSVE